MKSSLSFLSVAIFSIFIGSQLAEGVLLVPYWQSLSNTAFYEYYAAFGPVISMFYTVLTLTAVSIPIVLSLYCFLKKQSALKPALLSSFFSLLCIALFYSYFKGTNQQFYQASFDANQLKVVLETWAYWHWFRVFFELLSLLFLCKAFNKLHQLKNQTKH